MQAFLDRVSELGLVGLVRFIMTMAFRRGVMISRSVATVAAEHVMSALFVEHTVVSLLSAVVKNRTEEYMVDLDFMDPDGELQAAVRTEVEKTTKSFKKDEVDQLVRAITIRRLANKYGLDKDQDCFCVTVRGELKFFLKMETSVFEEFMAAIIVMEVMGGIEAATVTAVDFTEQLVPRLINEEDDSEEEDLEDDEELALDFHGKYSDVFHERMEYFQNSKAYPLGCARINPHFGDEAADTDDEFVCLPSRFHGTVGKKTKTGEVLTKEGLTKMARLVALARKGYSDPAIIHLKKMNRFISLPKLSIQEYQAAYLYVLGMYGFEAQDPEMNLKSAQVSLNGSYKAAIINGDRVRSIHNQDGGMVASWVNPEKMQYWSALRYKVVDLFKSADHREFTGPFQLSQNGAFLVGRKIEVDEFGIVWPAVLLGGSLAGIVVPLGNETKEEYLQRKAKFKASLKGFIPTDEYWTRFNETAPVKARCAWMFKEIPESSRVAFIAVQGDLERQILCAAGFTIKWNKPVDDNGNWTKPFSYQVLDLNGEPRSNWIDTNGSSEIVDDHGEDLDQLDQAV